jgi:hypothetical protein
LFSDATTHDFAATTNGSSWNLGNEETLIGDDLEETVFTDYEAVD